jgi:hypothetical protein
MTKDGDGLGSALLAFYYVMFYLTVGLTFGTPVILFLLMAFGVFE